MRKIVLDTNVVFAAFAAHGLCEKVYLRCLEEHCLFVSEYALDELREKLILKLKLPENQATEIAWRYEQSAQTVVPAAVDVDSCRDAKDLPFLGTCLEAGAEFLVTGDQDLLVLEEFGKTSIVSPRQFYEQVLF